MSEQNLLQQVGRFNIPFEFLETQTELLLEVMKQLSFIPLQVEHSYIGKGFDMVGISPHFRVLEQGQQVPFYIIRLNRESAESDLSITVSTEEVIAEK